MKWIQIFMGMLLGGSWIVFLLFTSVEFVAFDLNHYEKEYKKYNIVAEVDMEYEDLMEVTKEMLLYLRGERPTLDMEMRIGGEIKEVFNEREKQHMVDVWALFQRGYQLRFVGIVCIIFSLSILLWTRKTGLIILFRSLQISARTVFGLIGVLMILMYIDFNKYFTIFHEVFFDNDLWLLDPNTDILISIVPEPFFFATAVKISMIFIGSLILVDIGSTLGIRHLKRRKRMFAK